MSFDVLTNIFSTDGFLPRWDCGQAWKDQPWWGWIHIGSDIAIWVSYFAIPILLIFLAKKKRDVAFPRVFELFALFILLGGVAHLVDAFVFYWPAYRLTGLLKLAAAMVSMSTLVALFRVVPQAILLRGPKESQREIDLKTTELRELTEQLQQEVEHRTHAVIDLRRNREMLKLAMTAGDTGFFNWDLKTNRIVFDVPEIQLTGLGKSNGIINPDEFFECIDESHRTLVKEAMQGAIERDEPYDVRFPFTRRDGGRTWLAGRGCALRDESGAPQTFIGLYQDVKAQVEREQQLDKEALEAKKASEQKSRFIAQASHEIRTPLAAILGCIDSLLGSLEQGETRNTLSVARSQGELLQVLVNDVLDLSKIEAGRLHYEARPMAVAAVFADVWSLMNPLALEKGIALRWLPSTRLPSQILCDRHRFKQVLVNVIGNAIKFTDQGAVTIDAHVEKEAGSANSDLVVQIRDTGCGIPRDKLEDVFEEFEQAGKERSGAGLGLAICKRLLALMDGTISVRSEVGIGSCFMVRVPIGITRDEELTVIDHITQVNHDLSDTDDELARLPLRVIAAEDSRALQFVLQRMVGPSVDTLDIVKNGKEVVEQVMKAEGSSTPYDLVLMDIQMPELDGIEATRQLRREGFARPIIALTAGAMESERLACITAGCTHFTAKPIDLRELRRLMMSILEKD